MSKDETMIMFRVVPEKERKSNDMFSKLSYDMQTVVCGLGGAFLYKVIPIMAQAAEEDEKGVEGLVIALLNKGMIEVVKVSGPIEDDQVMN